MAVGEGERRPTWSRTEAGPEEDGNGTSTTDMCRGASEGKRQRRKGNELARIRSVSLDPVVKFWSKEYYKNNSI